MKQTNTRLVDDALALAQLAAGLALENRTHVHRADGRPENVAEHTTMLAIVAPAIAEQYYPHLDANLIARFAAIHDAVEAYVGDTPTHAASDQDLADKADREASGFKRLKANYVGLPKFVACIAEYERQRLSEARFVRVVDKWMPLLIHFFNDGATLRGYTTYDELRTNCDRRTVMLLAQYPEFSELLAVRDELLDMIRIRFYDNR